VTRLGKLHGFAFKEIKMSSGEEREMANENGEAKKSEETLVTQPMAPFPIFPFGLFLFPLIIPSPPPVEQKK
jgi:hypothetical protein